jgi:hypothetical protein
MKKAVVLVLFLVLASSAFAAVSLKAGLGGGAFMIGADIDRPVNDKVTVAAEGKFGLGNGYNVIVIGGYGDYVLRDNLKIGVDLAYTNYSSAVSLPGVGNLSSGGGVGAGIYGKMKIREEIYGKVGYDSRQGIVAEIDYLWKK